MATATQTHKLDDKVTRFVSKTQKMLINGKWVQSASGKTFATYNPANGEVLSQVAEGDREDIDRAVNSARLHLTPGRGQGSLPRSAAVSFGSSLIS